MAYLYLKKYPQVIPPPRHRWPLVPVALIVTGLALLVSAIGPILSYQLLRPTEGQGVVMGESFENTGPINWFTQLPQLSPRPSSITHYTLTIEKLKIKQAVVEIDGEDLGKAMVHYQGTAFPGQLGNAVIFCHSVLPQFFNPTNYKTICSTLPTIKKNEEIVVDYDGIQYRYRVREILEVKPDDVTILEQRYDNSYLSLITCVPPGTYLRRLIVRAELVII